MDLHPASLGSSPAGIHVSRWWQQEGHHPAIIATIMFPWAVESSPLQFFSVSVTNLNEPPRALAASTGPVHTAQLGRVCFVYLA